MGRVCNLCHRTAWHRAVARIFLSLRIDNIHGVAVIPCSPFGPRTYRLRRISCTPFGVMEIREECDMTKNPLLEYSEELATKCEFLCKSINGNANTVFQLRKSSSSVFANISEAQYPQSLADMLSKFKIARKECAETASWLKLLFNTKVIDEPTFKGYRNLCGRIQRLLTSACITIEKKIENSTK